MKTKAEFLEYVSLRYDELKNLDDSKSLYEFEKQIEDAVNSIGHELMTSKIEMRTKDRRKKKVFKGQYGEVALPSTHKLVRCQKGVKLLPMWQEKLVFLGMHCPYDKGSDLAKKFWNQDISATMIYRATDEVGKQAEEVISKLEESGKRRFPKKEDSYTYILVDGSMVFTREEKWKECKVGRIFQQLKRLLDQKDEPRLRPDREEYAAKLGHKDEFTKKIEELLGEIKEDRKDIVFISDGATWIRNWITEKYPQFIQILDFYHLMSYIGEYVETVESNKLFRKQVCEKAGFLLKKEGIDSALKVLEEKYQARSKKQKEAKERLSKYIASNKDRIDYPKYLSQGLIIGSGAVESAHRTLIQERMKLSGQRWSIEGAERLLSLREIYMSNRWNDLEEIFGRAA